MSMFASQYIYKKKKSAATVFVILRDLLNSQPHGACLWLYGTAKLNVLQLTDSQNDVHITWRFVATAWSYGCSLTCTPNCLLLTGQVVILQCYRHIIWYEVGRTQANRSIEIQSILKKKKRRQKMKLLSNIQNQLHNFSSVADVSLTCVDLFYGKMEGKKFSIF